MDDVNQKISCFIDDELKYNEVLNLLTDFQLHPELMQKVNRYQIASMALSSQRFSLINTDFLASIQQGIAKEPLYLLAVNPPIKKAYKITMALAACIALIAVLSIEIIDNKPLKYNPTSSSTMATVKKPPNQQNNFVSATPLLEKDPIKKQTTNYQTIPFNDYLQAYNTSFYTDGTPSFPPYMETISYKQD